MSGNLINKIKFSPVDIEERKALDFKAGDTVNVSSKIFDEKSSGKDRASKFRFQNFEGIVLERKHGREAGATFTVRKIASGVGVERIFPLYSPMIGKIKIIKRSHARRSKLYYIRTKAVKDVRKKIRSVANQKEHQKTAEEEVVE